MNDGSTHTTELERHHAALANRLREHCERKAERERLMQERLMQTALTARHAGDPLSDDKYNAIQLAAGGMISRKTAMTCLGIDSDKELMAMADERRRTPPRRPTEVEAKNVRRAAAEYRVAAECRVAADMLDEVFDAKVARGGGGMIKRGDVVRHHSCSATAAAGLLRKARKGGFVESDGTWWRRTGTVYVKCETDVPQAKNFINVHVDITKEASDE